MTEVQKGNFILVAFVAFVHGAIIVSIMILFMMSNFDDDLYDELVQRYTQAEMSPQEKALSLLNATHSLLTPRLKIFEGSGHQNLRSSILRSSDIQLIDARGECGSYSHVLGRLLQRAGFEVRLAQMQCGHISACHIVLEAKVDGRFVVLDGLYNQSFLREDGRLASYQEVSNNWDYYRTQLDDDYPLAFSYQGVRYTNWDKIPWLLPIFKQLLAVFVGDEVNQLSIRSWVLNVYKTYMFGLMIVYFPILLLSIYRVKSSFTANADN